VILKGGFDMFESILYLEKPLNTIQEAPVYFHDLNLDQIVDTVTSGKQEYDLKPFYYTPLCDADAVRYRQEVMRELEGPDLYKSVHSFASRVYSVYKGMQTINKNLSQPDSYTCNYLEKGRLLDAVNTYCNAVESLVQGLASLNLKSRGLSAFFRYLADYADSEAFQTLRSETGALKANLFAIRYCMLIKNNSIRVRKYEGETDHTVEIEQIFEKFKQGDVQDYRQRLSEEPYAMHVEAGVLNLLAKIYSEIFSTLDRYCAKNKNFIDQTIAVFSREIQFYISYLEYIEKFKKNGLHFCYPEVSNENKNVYDYDGFDLALAGKLISAKSPIVCNDFNLNGSERIIVVSGPNQGGKTTFARTFGQLHHLASIGCPVPGRDARMFLFDSVFTHFEKEEDISNLSGKLQDDLIRMHDIMEHATPDSIIIINEILSSTTLDDAVSIGKKLMSEIVQQDTLCVCVTFLDELASYSEKCVSMVSTVVPEDPARRTYKILRNPADGLAYAMYIAKKYRLTYDCLKERIQE
jgi:DNA mismatch repair protein MutS